MLTQQLNAAVAAGAAQQKQHINVSIQGEVFWETERGTLLLQCTLIYRTRSLLPGLGGEE